MSNTKKNRTLSKTIGSRLETAIENKGLKKKDVAAMLGFTPQTISGYVNGSREIEYDIADKLAEILDIPASSLLTPAQKTKKNSAKTSRFEGKNEELVNFLGYLGFNVTLKTNSDMQISCKIEDSYAKPLLNKMVKLYTNLKEKNMISETEFNERLQTEMNKSLSQQWGLTSIEWDEMKEEIEETVKKIVRKRIQKIEVDRIEMLNLLYNLGYIQDSIGDNIQIYKENPLLLDNINSILQFCKKYHPTEPE